MKVEVGDIVVLSPDFPEAEVHSAPGMARQAAVGTMTAGNVAVVLEVFGSSALEAKVLFGDTVGWVYGSLLRRVISAERTKQEISK